MDYRRPRDFRSARPINSHPGPVAAAGTRGESAAQASVGEGVEGVVVTDGEERVAKLKMVKDDLGAAGAAIDVQFHVGAPSIEVTLAEVSE